MTGRAIPTRVQPTVFDATVTVGWSNAGATCTTHSWPAGWDPPVMPPSLLDQLVDSFLALHGSALLLKEAWS